MAMNRGLCPTQKRNRVTLRPKTPERINKGKGTKKRKTKSGGEVP